MLFQPTNITPDVINGIGNGTIDVSEGLTVSWQINGNSPILKYQLFFYQNNAASTSVYTPSAVTLDSPAYGTDENGNQVLFTAETIPSATLTTNGITNGNQYKMMIRQWYGSGADDYLDQRSMSVFNTRENPTLSITLTDANATTVSTALLTRSATITGSYSQAQNDTLSWVNWKIEARYTVGSQYQYVSVLDTGKMYNVSVLSTEYDGFVNHQWYRITLTVCTDYGIVVSESKSFSTSWSESSISGTASACRINSQSTAMKVTWSGYRYIDGNPSGDYNINRGTLELPTGSSVVWNNENGSPLSIAAPWAVRMQTNLKKQSAGIIKVTTTSDYVEIKYDLASRKFQWATSSNNSGESGIFTYDSTVQVIITPTQIRLYGLEWLGGLTPSNSLTPSESLTPRDAQYPYVHTTTIDITYTQGSITGIETSGLQVIDYIQIINNYTQDDLTALSVNDFGYDPDNNMISSTYFLLDFETDTLDAGTMKIAGTSIANWAIYRRKESEPIAIHLTDADVASHYFLDYGCGSGEGMYHYEIYPVGDKKYLTNAITTNSFNPCFENWSVIEATYNKETNQYIVVNEYIFGKNLSSGSISNNNTPTVYKNFTRYPTVLRARPNYQSGTLSSLIGHIGFINYIIQEGDTLSNIASRFHTTEAKIIQDNVEIDSEDDVKVGMVLLILLTEGMTTYFDDKKLRDMIWNLSTTTNTLFLKSRKGDVMEIAPSQDISMSYMDSTRQQAVTVSFPWVQVGDATHKTIIGVANIDES